MIIELINKCLTCGTDAKKFVVADDYKYFTKEFDEVMEEGLEKFAWISFIGGSDLAEEQQ